HGEVEDEEPAGREMAPHAGKEALEVAPRGEVEDGVERRDDERKAPSQPDLSHVPMDHGDALAHLGRLATEPALEPREHRPRRVDTRHVEPNPAKRGGDAPRPDAVLE